MPCFNHGEFLQESILSVLGQEHGDLELIVVDDCSTDSSPEIAAECARADRRVRVITQTKNQGLSRARNAAMKIARGDLIAFCDSDDVWEPSKLKIQLALANCYAECDLVYSDALIIDGNGKSDGRRFSQEFPLPKLPSGLLFYELILRNFINIQTVLVRKVCLEEAGGFDERIELVQDWLMWVRLSRQHAFTYCEEPLARYRVHARSTNIVQKRQYAQNRFKVFRRILAGYDDLSEAARSEILYKMSADLLSLGRIKLGRRVLFEASCRAGCTTLAARHFCAGLLRLFRAANSRLAGQVARRSR